MTLTVTRLSDVAPKRFNPDDLDPYPLPDSYSGECGLQVFDLITPDGDRVWVTAGWSDQGMLRAWTIKDFVEDRIPGKQIPDDPRRFAPLMHVNSSADLRESFISDYMALHHNVGQHEWRLGLDTPESWTRKKVYPYRGYEHIVINEDAFLRLLTLDDRNGNTKSVDIWEATASWHFPWQEKRLAAHPCQGGQFLYRLYDGSGVLLYVGITDNVFRRWREHSKCQPWWPAVHTFTQDSFPDRQAVEAAERLAIRSERPVYNKIHAL